MKISGFTLVRNGSKFDYPYIESIRSLLPLVDELVVNVGKGEDNTLQQIQNLKTESSLHHQKIKIVESEWPLKSESMSGGKILADQTNLALRHCTGDWCLYLQADEVLHEEDYSRIRESFERHLLDSGVEGLLFDYRHFYGSYEVIQDTRSAYRREVRAFKRSTQAQSVGDAQSFRKPNGQKLRVARPGIRIFHYGWVRTPEAMKEKTVFMDQLYHGAREQNASPATGNNYLYKRFWGLKPFQESHPQVMERRIAKKGWHWDLENSPFVWEWADWKKVVSDTFERFTGNRLFEYRSYILVSESKGVQYSRK